MSGPATARSYEESVGSCGPTTPHTPPAPPAPRSAPVRRQLDFTGIDDLDDDELLCRLADDIDRGYSEAKRRAPPCVCGRGQCAVERDDQSGRWKYICPSRPKCNHAAFCEEVDLNPKSQPTSRSHPKPINPCAFNDPSNHITGPRAPINICPHVTGTITPVSVRPQVAGATTLFSDSPQGARATTLVNVSRHSEGAATPANDSLQGVGSTTPAKFIPQGAVATALAKASSQGAKSNERPDCQCTAGRCKKSRIGEEDWYVCPIPKGKGACSYRVLVRDFVKHMVPSAQATPCGGIHQESPSMLQRPIAAANTPSKSPMQPLGTPSPISLNSNNACFRCHETGHWMRDCPKQSPKDGACFKCGMVGHWMRDCPKQSPKDGACSKCGMVGHWMRDCPKQSPKDGACFKCGMVGHWSRNRPQL